MLTLKHMTQTISDYTAKLKGKGAFHVFIGNFITKFVAFFASIFIVRLFSKEDYGLLSFSENIFGYIYLLAGFGLTNALLRYVVLKDNIEEKYGVYKYIIKKSTIINVFIVLIAIFIFVFVYPYSESFTKARFLIPFLILALPFHSITDTSSMLLRSMFDTKRFAIISCCLGTSVLIMKYIFSYFAGLNGAFISNVIVYLIWAIGLLILIKKSFFDGVTETKLAPIEKREIDKYSLQYMVTNGLWTVFMLNDIFLLGRLIGDATVVAEYKVAYALPGNLSIFASSIGMFIAPYFVKHETDNQWVQKNYKIALLTSVVIIGAISLILGIFAEQIITLLYGETYVSVVPIMRVLLFASFVNNAIRYTNANLLSAMGKVKINMFVSLGGMILQVLLDCAMIPKFGVIGLAYTSIFVYLCMAIALLIAFKKTFERVT